MDDNEFQAYRDNLAREIKQLSGSEERRNLLNQARSTTEYKEANRLRRIEFSTPFAEQKGFTNTLADFMQQNYADYVRFDPSLLKVFHENKVEFYNQTISTASWR